MGKDKEYNSSDIEVLTDVEHVRKRTQVYLGNMNVTKYEVPSFINDQFQIKEYEFIPAVYKSIGEILDNCVDELVQIGKGKKTIEIIADTQKGSYQIRDSGRGVPIDIHTEYNKYTPELVFSLLRSGRNFSDDKAHGVQGMNGVGSTCVNYVSETFKVSIDRDNKNYTQIFKNGCSKIYPPTITNNKTTNTGTEISFILDNNVFKNIDIPDELMENRAIQIAFNNPNFTVTYNNKPYQYHKGLEQIIKNFSSDYYTFSSEDQRIQFYVLFDINKNIDEKIFTWVNSSFLFDGGICNTQFLNSFIDRTINQLSSASKKNNCEITKNDVRQNLLIFGCIKVSNPEYDSQAKTRLTGPTLRKEFDELLEHNWNKFYKNKKEWFDKVLQNAISRHTSKEITKAIKETDKKSTKKIPGLLDATSKIRSICKILITEGQSAAAMCSQVRDPETIAAFPLTGKINNVYGKSISQVLQMGKLTDLLLALGLVPGRKADLSTLRYGKILIATDADNDGDDIMSLLVNLFFQYWPELFSNCSTPIVYRLLAPNVVATKGKQRKHFVTRSDYESQKETYRNWNITYCKGLGSMDQEDWKLLLQNEDCFLPIVDVDDTMKDTLQLLFGPDADMRKEWLIE